MTKKHFIALAAAIAEARQRHGESPEVRYALADVTDAIARVAMATNPNFNREKFYEACGEE